MPALFAYGTLRDTEICAAVLGRQIRPFGRPAWAEGFRAVHYPGRPYPALVPAPGGRAPGVLIPALSMADFARLDAYEGEEYRRGGITAHTSTGPVKAEVYWPVMPIGAEAIGWTIENWRLNHKPTTIV